MKRVRVIRILFVAPWDAAYRRIRCWLFHRWSWSVEVELVNWNEYTTPPMPNLWRGMVICGVQSCRLGWGRP